MKKLWMGLIAAASMQAAMADPAGQVRGLVGLGLTVGGDTIGTVNYNNGTSSDLTAGGTVDLRGGLEYWLQGQPVALELSMGYHTDRVSANNGDATFTRFPLELIAHYALSPQLRVGVGARKSLNTKLDVSIDNGEHTKFKSSVGGIAEVEYFFTPQFSLKGRYVVERFTSDDAYKDKLEGDHLGVYGMLYF